MYIAVSSIVINIVLSVVLTVLARALKVPAGADRTGPDDYVSDAQSPEVAATAEREIAGVEATAPGSYPPGGWCTTKT